MQVASSASSMCNAKHCRQNIKHQRMSCFMRCSTPLSTPGLDNDYWSSDLWVLVVFSLQHAAPVKMQTGAHFMLTVKVGTRKDAMQSLVQTDLRREAIKGIICRGRLTSQHQPRCTHSALLPPLGDLHTACDTSMRYHCIWRLAARLAGQNIGVDVFCIRLCPSSVHFMRTRLRSHAVSRRGAAPCVHS